MFYKVPFTSAVCSWLTVDQLSSHLMRDDISKMNDTLEQAREGCRLIDDTLRKKQVSVNYNKSKYLLIGSTKFRRETLKTLKEDPMNMGGVIIDHSEKEKYLGDWISEKGCRASISETVKVRTTG